MVHFGVTKKDPGLLIRFHVLNLSKSWSNLGFDQDMIQMRRNLKKSEKMKNQSTSYSNHTNHVSIPPNPKLCLMKSSTKRSGFGFQTWKFEKPPRSFILEWQRRIQAYLFHFHVLNLFKSYSNLGFDQDSNRHKNSKKMKKWKTKSHSLLMSYSKHSSW